MALITKNDLKQGPTTALSDHYHHARKLYGLFSGLLLLWALVGVEIQETPIESLKLRLMNPEAVPIILFSLVLYFGFRFTIEWSQCDRLRRQYLASRVDFYAAHIVGLVAVLIYGFQQASTIRVSEYVAQFPLATQLPVAILAFIIQVFVIDRVLLLCGEFNPSSDKGLNYSLKLNTQYKKTVFIFGCLAVLPPIPISVLIAISYWVEGALVPFHLVFIAGLIAIPVGVIWVLFFHSRFQLDRIPPAAPQNFKV